MQLSKEIVEIIEQMADLLVEIEELKKSQKK